MALTLSDIGYRYRVSASPAETSAALDGVSLDLGCGELVLVLGATGSGKSTLFRVAAGLLDPESGRAAVDGEPLTRATARGAVGLVFQDAESQLFAETVADDVAFGPRNLGSSPERARELALEALARVGLAPDTYAARSPFTLSGGEARRVAIAGVLAMQPRYLLLDEPTSGLDARGRAAVRALVRAERERSGIAIVSHSAEEFLGEADRVVLLQAGRCAFSGPASALIADPSEFRTAGLRAPDVLLVQELALTRRASVGAFSLDPVAAAGELARAWGWPA